jgi:hypothetical protein
MLAHPMYWLDKGIGFRPQLVLYMILVFKFQMIDTNNNITIEGSDNFLIIECTWSIN